jgi:beta-aspartyl-peptidase (threonine type)
MGRLPSWRVRGAVAFVVLLFLCLPLLSRPTDDKPEVSASKKAIQKVLDDQVAAWNKGDLEGFMTGYWNSDDLSFYSGKDKTHGWKATLERYQKKYQSEGREMGKLTFSDLEIDVLCPESAFVRGRWKLVTSKDTPGGLFTLIFKKLPDGWRIIHDHTSS